MIFKITNKADIIKDIQEFFNLFKYQKDYFYIHLHFAHFEDAHRAAENEISEDETIEIVGIRSFNSIGDDFQEDSTILDSIDIKENFNRRSTRQDICAKILEKEINFPWSYEEYVSWWRYENN
jgi:hypothetical protein